MAASGTLGIKLPAYHAPTTRLSSSRSDLSAVSWRISLGTSSTRLRSTPPGSEVMHSRRASRVVSAVSDSVPADQDSVVVKFILQRECHFGQTFSVCGGHPALGEWEVSKAPKAEWSDGHVWTATAVLPRVDLPVPFKFVMMGKRGEQEWQAGDNHRLHLVAVAPHIEVEVPWSTAEPLVITNLEVDDDTVTGIADITGLADYSVDESKGGVGEECSQTTSVVVTKEAVVGGAVTAAAASGALEGIEVEASTADAAITAAATAAGEEAVAGGESTSGSLDLGLRREEEEILEALKESSNGVASSLLAGALGPTLSGTSQRPIPSQH